MSISGIRTAIANAVGTTGLTSFDRMPTTVNPPCAYVLPTRGNWNVNLPRDTGDNFFEVVLLFTKQGLIEETQSTIDSYMSATGSTSIKRAIETGNYTGHANFAYVVGWRDYGKPVDFNGIQYASLTFEVETR